MLGTSFVTCGLSTATDLIWLTEPKSSSFSGVQRTGVGKQGLCVRDNLLRVNFQGRPLLLESRIKEFDPRIRVQNSGIQNLTPRIWP